MTAFFAVYVAHRVPPRELQGSRLLGAPTLSATC